MSIKPNFFDKLGVLFHRRNIRLVMLHPYISVHLRGPMISPEPNKHLRGTLECGSLFSMLLRHSIKEMAFSDTSAPL